MKKALALLLVLVMGLCFIVSCTGNSDNGGNIGGGGAEILDNLDGKTSDEIFEDIVEVNTSITNYTMVATTIITYQGTTVTNQVDLALFNGANQSGTTTVNGDLYTEYWWIDGIYYAQANGQKIKAELTYDQYLAFLGQDAGTATFLNYPLSWFTDTVIKKDGSNYYLEGTIDATQFNAFIGSTANASVSNISFKLYITASGEFVNLTMEYDQTTSGLTYHCSTVGEFKDINSTVVNAPSNPDSFISVNLGM